MYTGRRSLRWKIHRFSISFWKSELLLGLLFRARRIHLEGRNKVDRTPWGSTDGVSLFSSSFSSSSPFFLPYSRFFLAIREKPVHAYPRCAPYNLKTFFFFLFVSLKRHLSIFFLHFSVSFFFPLSLFAGFIIPLIELLIIISLCNRRVQLSLTTRRPVDVKRAKNTKSKSPR